MELLNGEIYAGAVALAELSQKDLPVKVSLGLAKINIAISPSYQAIQKVRNDLVAKHGKPDEERGGRPTVREDAKEFPDYFKELTEVMTEKSEVEFQKVTLPLEVNGKSLQVSAQVLEALMGNFIEVQGEAKNKE